MSVVRRTLDHMTSFKMATDIMKYHSSHRTTGATPVSLVVKSEYTYLTTRDEYKFGFESRRVIGIPISRISTWNIDGVGHRHAILGLCSPGFRNGTLGYGDRGSKSYPWLRRMGQNLTLDNRKYHQINHFWSNFAWNWSNLTKILLIALKNYLIRSKWPKFADSIGPWLRSRRQN